MTNKIKLIAGVVLVMVLSTSMLSGCSNKGNNGDVKEFKRIEKEYEKLDMDKVNEYIPKIEQAYKEYVLTEGNRYGSFLDPEGNKRRVLLGKLQGNEEVMSSIKDGEINTFLDIGEDHDYGIDGIGVYIDVIDLIVEDISFISRDKNEYLYIVHGSLYTTGAGSFNDKESRVVRVKYDDKEDKVSVEEMHEKYKNKSREE